MRIHNLLRLFTLTGIGMLISFPHNASAQFPTFDVSAVKETISTNIEMVKQSKVVTDAMATAGKINAGIGDAKASASKFVGDNLAKAQEKMKKLQEEKERIEEKKKKYDEMKKKLDEKKQQLEEAKARVEKAKAMAEDAKNMAKEAKETVADAKELAKSKVDNAKSQAGLDDTAPVENEGESTVSSSRTAFGSNADEEASPYEVTPPNSDAKVYGEVQIPENLDEAMPVEDAEPDVLEAEERSLNEEQEALDREKAELEVDAMFAKTPEEKAAIEAKKAALAEKEADLKARKDENAAKQSETKEIEAVDGNKPKDNAANADEEKNKEPQPFHRAKILDGDTSTKMEVPESHRAKILDTYQAPESHRPKILDQAGQSGASSGGFRKRATPDKTSALNNGRQFASRRFSETLVFAQLGTEDMPDGTVDGVFILSDRLANECDVNVKSLEDEKVMDDCIKKLVAMKSSKDNAIAQEANAIYKTIMQETVNALIAESMANKNVAANYETKVLEKMEKSIANTKNTRDDTGGLSLTNKELQYLLNRILTIYSAQLSLDSLTKVGSFDASYYEDLEEDSDDGENK